MAAGACMKTSYSRWRSAFASARARSRAASISRRSVTSVDTPTRSQRLSILGVDETRMRIEPADRAVGSNDPMKNVVRWRMALERGRRKPKRGVAIVRMDAFAILLHRS